MRTLLRLGLAVAMLASLVAAPGAAEEEEIEPIDMTLYLHGREVVGELEIAHALTDGYMAMNEQEPADPTPKSMVVTNYVAGPNTVCSGSPLVPTWSADFEGTLVGDVEVTLHALSPGSTVEVRLYADVGDIACNSGDTQDYVPAIAEQEVELEAGFAEHTVTFSDLDVHIADRLILTVFATDTNQARLFYDSADYAANVALSCVPLSEDADTCLWG